MQPTTHPFAADPAAAVSALGERALLRAIRGWLGDVAPAAPHGMGDDCAVIPNLTPDAWLATTDGVVYGRHFDDSAAPAAVGAKLLKRNLSDLAAMGGRPGPALINLLLARNTATAWLGQFYAGLAQTCRAYGVSLVGGDLAQGPAGVFAAHLTLLGHPGKNIRLRAGARLGDILYVTGELGGSLLGHHLDFTPRLAEGQWLAERDGVRAMMDVTDGLAKDLPEILPAGADALLDCAALPVSAAAHALAARDGRSALAHALCDGEDYELLFALDPAIAPEIFASAWAAQFPTPLTRIGRLARAVETAPGRDRQLRDAATGAPLLPAGAGGYEHLR